MVGSGDELFATSKAKKNARSIYIEYEYDWGIWKKAEPVYIVVCRMAQEADTSHREYILTGRRKINSSTAPWAL